MWNTTQFGIHAGSDVYSHSAFTKAQSPNVTTPRHLTAEHPVARCCVQKGRCGICRRSCMTDRMKETSLVLRRTIMKPNSFFFFFFLNCNLYSLQNAAWNLMFVLWNTVILWLWQRAAECFLMNQWQLFLSFDLFGKHQASVDLSLTTRKLAVAFCTLRHYQFWFWGFKHLKVILSVEVFEERNRCLTVYTERPWQGVSSRFVLLSGVRLIPNYVILIPLLSWYKKA